MIKLRQVFFALLLAVVAIAVAGQWGQWQTGRVTLEPLDLTPGGLAVAPSGRIWIDTDAACGATIRTDPDDCLAILVADRTAALVAQMARDGMQVPPVFLGHGAPSALGARKPPGVDALQAALEAGPLTILALGPLTNVAAALEGRPDMLRNVTRIVAVMGHRPGHLFHPTEGKGSGAMFGHGPIFRDLNVSVDPDAVGTVLALAVPITLIPYDAARNTLIIGTDLDDLARNGAASEWVAQSAQPWLAFWNDEVGLHGFYPFDLLAAAYLTDPGLFNCATVTARMTREWTFWIMPRASLVVERRSAPGVMPGQDIQYCPETSTLLHGILIAP